MISSVGFMSQTRHPAEALLVRIFRAQGYRELGALRLFTDGMALAPDFAAVQEMAEEARQERAHLDDVLRVWTECVGCRRDDAMQEVETRLREKPLPIVRTWLDLALARFLYDRAGYFQLRDFSDCSYEPYRGVVLEILDDEMEHQDAGARALLEMLPQRGRPTRRHGDLVGAAAAGAVGLSGDEAQASFEHWLAVSLFSFGRAGTNGSRLAIVAGLKRRDGGEVMRDYIADITPTVERAGLLFPSAATLKERFGVELPAGLW